MLPHGLDASRQYDRVVVDSHVNVVVRKAGLGRELIRDLCFNLLAGHGLGWRSLCIWR